MVEREKTEREKIAESFVVEIISPRDPSDLTPSRAPSGILYKRQTVSRWRGQSLTEVEEVDISKVWGVVMINHLPFYFRADKVGVERWLVHKPIHPADFSVLPGTEPISIGDIKKVAMLSINENEEIFQGRIMPFRKAIDLPEIRDRYIGIVDEYGKNEFVRSKFGDAVRGRLNSVNLKEWIEHNESLREELLSTEGGA